MTVESQSELLNNLEEQRAKEPLATDLEELYQTLKANISVDLMNINVNIYEYIEQLGCHNCENCKKDFIPRKLRCKLDNVEVAPWGKCKKWKEKGIKEVEEKKETRDGKWAECPRCKVKRSLVDGVIPPHWVFENGFATMPCE